MNHDSHMWARLAAYSLHVVEEFVYDWKDLAVSALWLPVYCTVVFLVNAAVIVLWLCCAQVGWRLTKISLIFASLMIINGISFSHTSHALSSSVTRSD